MNSTLAYSGDTKRCITILIFSFEFTLSVTTIPSISLSANSYNGFVNTSNNGFWLGDSTTLTKSENTPSSVTVNWKSSNTSVVTVNSNGKLISVGGGSVTIIFI